MAQTQTSEMTDTLAHLKCAAEVTLLQRKNELIEVHLFMYNAIKMAFCYEVLI